MKNISNTLNVLSIFSSFYSQRFGNAILFNNRKYNIVDEVIFNNNTIVYPTCKDKNEQPTFEKNIETDNETRSIGGVLLQKSDETNKKFITCVTHTTEKVIFSRNRRLDHSNGNYNEKIPENFHRQIVSLNIVGELFQELAQIKFLYFLEEILISKCMINLI